MTSHYDVKMGQDKDPPVPKMPFAVAEWIARLLFSAEGIRIESRHPTSATYVACGEYGWLPIWLSRGWQVSHQK